MIKRIKMNWGTGIVIAVVLFMIITVGMTVFFMNQDVDLVSDNYYEKELKYQQQIDKLQQTKDMNAEVDIQTSSNAIVIKFPERYLSSKISGEVVMYRPSNSKKDYKIAVLRNNGTNEQFIPSANLEKGLWRIKINWQAENTTFYSEKNLMVY